VIIDHVAEDATYCGHHTPAKYGFQSYISMPIMLPDGSMFGTLCAIDPRPAKLNRPEIVGMFKLFAELIAIQVDYSDRLETTQATLSDTANRLVATEASLLDVQQTSELREQFIAVLGHDLRNPIAAIGAGTNMLMRTPLNDKAQKIVTLMQGSVTRVTGLIDNLLDFARGRLGGGLTLDRDADEPLKPLLMQVTEELRQTAPGREIDTHFDFADPVNCDRIKLTQLYSNLLGNALTHGAADRPVGVRASGANGMFELSVANAGPPIPSNAMTRLFAPFTRGEARARQQGLGLGLYIALQIAAAHGGNIEVASDENETRFTFRMPLH
jgi:signal transduction histidine kinase